MTDWEKRARELFWPAPHNGNHELVERALRFGREMQMEVADQAAALALRIEELQRKAADARAQEIAKAIELRKKEHIRPAPSAMFIQQGLIDAAKIARSFIEKQKPADKLTEDDFLREQRLIQKTRDEAYDRGWREGQEAERASVVCEVPVGEAAIRADEREKVESEIRGNVLEYSRATQALIESLTRWSRRSIHADAEPRPQAKEAK